MRTSEIKRALRQRVKPGKAELLQRFFKTGPGEYGEGDRFLGIMVPDIRRVATQYTAAPLRQVTPLLHSRIHEERLLALLILVEKFKRSDDPNERRKIFDFYLANTRWVNNWDLVDLTAGRIVGAFLADGDRSLLYRLARSSDLWERRIAIVATSHFIGANDFEDTLRIAEMLLGDTHDLIHKAVGWMLREVGKRDFDVEEQFVKRHAKVMPRTMLRYAIERFPEPKRLHYLTRSRR